MLARKEGVLKAPLCVVWTSVPPHIKAHVLDLPDTALLLSLHLQIKSERANRLA